MSKALGRRSPVVCTVSCDDPFGKVIFIINALNGNAPCGSSHGVDRERDVALIAVLFSAGDTRRQVGRCLRSMRDMFILFWGFFFFGSKQKQTCYFSYVSLPNSSKAPTFWIIDIHVTSSIFHTFRNRKLDITAHSVWLQTPPLPEWLCEEKSPLWHFWWMLRGYAFGSILWLKKLFPNHPVLLSCVRLS